MTARDMGMSIGLNIVATSVGWYIKGPTGAIVVGCAGIAITAITHFLTRKPASPPQLPPPPISQDVKQEANPQMSQQFSPQFNPTITIGGLDNGRATTQQEEQRQEQIALECLRKHQGRPLLVQSVSLETGMSFDVSAQALRRLFAKELAYRSSVDADGDFIYWSFPPPDNSPHCNIEFSDVEVTTQVTADGGSIITACAIFENEHVKGRKLLIPTLRARLIFKHPDGHLILDLSDASWWPNEQLEVTFSANSPRQLLLFFSPSPYVAAANLWARSVVQRQLSGHHRFVFVGESHPIIEKIASVEVQLLTDSECLYRNVLRFEDDGDGFPRFVGAEN